MSRLLFVKQRVLSSTLFLLPLLSFALKGATIYDSGTVFLPASSPVQSGIVVSSGIPSDWSTQPTFPGVTDVNGTFAYDAFSLPNSAFPYLQINFLDLSDSEGFFASAYLNSYNPDSTAPNAGLSLNYLGDEGQPGDPYGNPTVFQVTLPNPASDHLVLVVTDTTNGAAGQPFSFLVEGFYDTSFDDSSSPTPEPGSILLTLCGLIVGTVYKLRTNRTHKPTL